MYQDLEPYTYIVAFAKQTPEGRLSCITVLLCENLLKVAAVLYDRAQW